MRLLSSVSFILLFSIGLLVYPGLSASAQEKLSNVAVGTRSIPLFYEKVYLHTDRSYFSSGEDIWFSAYLVNAKGANLTASSNSLYVELLSPENAIMDRKVIRLNKGLGKGDFALQDSITAGWYRLRAYTNWMRNFEDNFLFEKEIYISGKLTAKKDDKSGPMKGLPVANTIERIQFFPEGGSLVTGNQGLVAFKAEDANGEGIKVSGKLLNSSGETLSSFESTDLGMGLFTLTPQPDQKYKVEGKYEGGKSFSSELPAAQAKGISLHVTQDSVQLKCIVAMNEAMFQESKGHPVVFQFKHAGDVVKKASVPMNNAQITVTIPLKELPSGLAVLTIFDRQDRPQCERLIYIPLPEIRLSISTDRKVYAPQQRTQLTIRVRDHAGKPQQAAISLAAVDALVPANGKSIVSYLMLESEIKGLIQRPQEYFDPENTSRLRQLELLLLTQGWRDYLWKKLPVSDSKISFLPEAGITLSGRLRQKVGNSPLPGMNITLFGNGLVGDKIYSAKTDADGRYFFDGLSWFSEQDLRLTATDNNGKPGGWLLLDSVFKSPMPVKPYLPFPVREQGLALFEQENERRMDLNRIAKNNAINLKEVVIGAEKQSLRTETEILTSFGYPDYSYDIKSADHEFNDLQHFLLGKVPGVYARSDSSAGVAFISRGKKVTPRLVINKREDMFERVDYYGLPMDQVNKVVVKHLINIDGNDSYVIGLDLKETAFGGNNLHLLNKTLNGYYSAREFYIPNFTDKSGRSKDLRTTIHWAPSLKTDVQGQVKVVVQNADPKSTIGVYAEGITDEGVPISGFVKYKVE